ncbi:LysR family transcriptional regulator [Paracoccus siganidrum]|uniref:LysR family transcriptional regulator n=1 Tax=Paracoccus siganidrum TaxID=1276757 RepID=UPI001F0C7439|nr:LysR family transcriptional regulator [Paracoccus siganidrum]
MHCFVVLAEELNFTRAARRLNMSQPPLSTLIQSLEREVGTELLSRTSRKMALTRAGEAFLLRARNILAQHQRSLLEIDEIKAGQHGMIEIGTTGSILRGGLADLLATFCRDHPRITVRIHEQSPTIQISEVISRRADVSFNRSIPADDELAYEFAWREELVALLPDTHPAAGQESVSIRELRHDAHVILRPDSSDFAAYVMSHLSSSGYRPRISQQVVDAQSIPSLIVAGFGVGVVPSAIARLTSGPLVFLPIRPDPPVSDVFAVYRQHDQTPALQVFLKAMREVLGKPPGGDRS